MAVQKASADRTVAIRDFNAKRVKSHLIDESDLLTSEAQAKSKEFDLKVAIDNERTSARSFNSARGVDSDRVDELLSLPDPQELQKISIPSRAALRDDVKSAEESAKAAIANAEVSIQKQKPVLNLVTSISTNGFDPDLQKSLGLTATTQYPYYTLGINFSFPLDTGTVSSVNKAYAQQMKGAEPTYQRRLFDQENEWKDLVKKLEEAKERLSLAVDVERAQKLKFEHEGLRQRQGATTTYQVFLYELDYLNAELSRIQTQSTILSLLAQIKTFRGEP